MVGRLGDGGGLLVNSGLGLRGTGGTGGGFNEFWGVVGLYGD
jgi:hypothetical protein